MTGMRRSGRSGDTNEHDRIRGAAGFVADAHLGLAGQHRYGDCGEERSSNDGQTDERRATTEEL